MAFMIFQILGTIIPTDSHIFQRGRYTTKQPLNYHGISTIFPGSDPPSFLSNQAARESSGVWTRACCRSSRRSGGSTACRLYVSIYVYIVYNMYIYIYAYMHICIYVLYIYIYVFMRTCICMYVYIYKYVNVYMSM